jgi:MYXO-CTERM domain-containing protein
VPCPSDGASTCVHEVVYGIDAGETSPSSLELPLCGVDRSEVEEPPELEPIACDGSGDLPELGCGCRTAAAQGALPALLALGLAARRRSRR